MSFERHFADGSGVEHAVRLADDQIMFEDSMICVAFPTSTVDWLLQVLMRIKQELEQEVG